MNFYLIIIGILIVLLGLNVNMFKNISKFTPVNIPAASETVQRQVPEAENQYQTEIRPQANFTEPYLLDSRYQYKYQAPVNTNVKQSVIRKHISASPDLYYTQTYNAKNALVDSPPVEATNELYYSGGHGQIIQIPLQYNVPNEPEQLRSQDIFITPYNRIKYSLDPPSNEA